MKNFLKLIETVNEQGGVYVHNPMKNAKGDGWTLDPHLSPSFAKIAKECQVFVFSSKNPEPLDIDLSVKAAVENNQVQGKLEPLDAPFTTFSIEMIEGPITGPRPGDNPVYTDCVMVHEESGYPLHYWVILLSRFEKEGKEPSYFVSVDLAADIPSEKDKVSLLTVDNTVYLFNQVVLSMVRSFLERLSTEAAGQEKVNERIKVRSGGHKEIVKIKRLIHIAPKSQKKEYEKGSREVEWSHRWFSRGHWRSLPQGQLGKNREGLYVENGRTWVSESIKGPDHKELVSKVRVVAE